MRLDPGQIECVDDDMARVLRRKTGAERLKIANDMFVSARKTILAMLRAEHSNWNEQQLNAETARRISHGAVAPSLQLEPFLNRDPK